MKKLFRNDAFLGAALAAASLLVYGLTALPSVGYDDSGELAASQYFLGVAHPTGYPLFMLLGRAFVLLVPGTEVIRELNLLGAILCAAGIFLYFRLFLYLLSGSILDVGSGSVSDRGENRIAAAAAALVLAFSRNYWFQAVSLEVYALHLVLLALALGLFLRALPRPALRPAPDDGRAWLSFAFVLGLGFANHVMTVLLAPALLYAFLLAHGWGRPAAHRILKAAPPFLLALSLYLYLPIRAAGEPVMNWGDPATWDAFWRHVTGSQFRHLMFSSSAVFAGNLRNFLVEIPAAFGYAPLLLAPAGLWDLRRAPRLLAFSLLLFLGCLLYSVNYDIPDIRSYLLQADIVIALWIAFGIRAAWRAPGRARWPARSLCASLFLFPLILNYRTADRSRDYAVEDHARNVLESVEPGALLFSNEYWLVHGPAEYLQRVRGFRPDVVVLDIGMFGHDWFYDQIETRHPGIFRESRREVGAYRAEIAKALRGRMDTAAYNARLADMFRSLVEKARGVRPVYVTSGINVDVLPGYYRLPTGMVFRLVHDSDAVMEAPLRTFSYRPLPRPEINPMAAIIRGGYADGYANQGAYRIALGDTASGAALLRQALEINPDFPEVAALLRELEPHLSGP